MFVNTMDANIPLILAVIGVAAMVGILYYLHSRPASILTRNFTLHIPTAPDQCVVALPDRSLGVGPCQSANVFQYTQHNLFVSGGLRTDAQSVRPAFQGSVTLHHDPDRHPQTVYMFQDPSTDAVVVWAHRLPNSPAHLKGVDGTGTRDVAGAWLTYNAKTKALEWIPGHSYLDVLPEAVLYPAFS